MDRTASGGTFAAMASPSAPSPAVRRRVVAVCVLPLALLALASCGDDDETETIPASGERETTTTVEGTSTTTAVAATDLTGDWTIDSLTDAGTTTEAPDGASIGFVDGSINVGTGCNRGTGSAEVGDGTIVVGPLGLTMMACETDVMTWEADLVAFLEGELTYELAGDSLVLSRDGADLALSPLE
jgi:heat shock protein HslJ